MASTQRPNHEIKQYSLEEAYAFALPILQGNGKHVVEYKQLNERLGLAQTIQKQFPLDLNLAFALTRARADSAIFVAQEIINKNDHPPTPLLREHRRLLIEERQALIDLVRGSESLFKNSNVNIDDTFRDLIASTGKAIRETCEQIEKRMESYFECERLFYNAQQQRAQRTSRQAQQLRHAHRAEVLDDMQLAIRLSLDNPLLMATASSVGLSNNNPSSRSNVNEAKTQSRPSAAGTLQPQSRPSSDSSSSSGGWFSWMRGSSSSTISPSATGNGGPVSRSSSVSGNSPSSSQSSSSSVVKPFGKKK